MTNGAALLLSVDDLPAVSGIGLVFPALFSLLTFARPLVAVAIVVKRGAEWDDARRAREAAERRYRAALGRGEVDDTLDGAHPGDVWCAQCSPTDHVTLMRTHLRPARCSPK